MRLAIWQGMGIVLLVALDLAVTRVPLSGRPVTEALLLMGGLPMANLLVVSGLVLIRGFGERDRLRPALIGFAVNGCAMLAILMFAGVARVMTRSWELLASRAPRVSVVASQSRE